MKVPRKLHELYSKIKTELRESQQNEKEPTIQVYRKLNVSEETILEAMEVGQNSKIMSLDAPADSKSPSSNKDASVIDQIYKP